MARFAPELAAIEGELRNGRKMFRRTLVATRLFLEAGGAAHKDTASHEIVKHVKLVVQDQADWGGWPKDEEVDQYRQRGRSRD